MKKTTLKIATFFAILVIASCQKSATTNVVGTTNVKSDSTKIDLSLQLPKDVEKPELLELKDEEILAPKIQYDKKVKSELSKKYKLSFTGANATYMFSTDDAISEGGAENYNTETYNYIEENNFKNSIDEPLSTFSIDVDEASYTNCRRYIQSGSLPPADAVRVEEFINYFDYQYPQPKNNEPFAVSKELSNCFWNPNHKLLHIGIQGKKYDFNEIPPMNLVFLIDVSGSMSDENKLPLLKKSFKLLVDQLRTKDKVAMVVYAGAAGLVLPSTSDKEKMIAALDQLQAGGSTAGGEGINLAYKVAVDNKIVGGCNRVILATDGDFNVGQSSDAEMVRLLEEKRKQGVYLTTLGFGMGNYKDSKMEEMADKGNGNNFYIDSFNEARKVLVTDIGSTLNTIAKDVKIQIEFNPTVVKAYRLVGYENRKLNKEDFNNDQKDAGELGAGHTVTALYEIITTDSKEDFKTKVDPLRYQTPKNTHSISTELATIKLRYKKPDEETSNLISQIIENKLLDDSKVSNNFKFAQSVTTFAMLLRNSKYKGDVNYESIIALASQNKGTDDEGYRAEFVNLIKTAKALKK